MKNEIEVIDNFLPDYYFKQFESILLGEEFPWYHSDHINMWPHISCMIIRRRRRK